MKKNKLTLIMILASLITSCGNINSAKLSEGMSFSQNTTVDKIDSDKINDFSLKLFSSCYDGENIIFSPISVLFALGMTAEGANGDTLAEIESTVGMSLQELEEQLSTVYAHTEENNGEITTVGISDSIWFRDHEFTPNENFLKNTAEIFGADIYSSAFDNSTKNDINNWVSDKTDGMIKEIIDEIDSDAIMYLVNAVNFDAEWSDIYEKGSVRKADFHLSNKDTQTVDMMYSEESIYLEGEDFSGFAKYYKGGNYAFAALLPNEDSSPKEVIESLDGKSLTKLLSVNSTGVTVNAGLPKFECEYSVNLNNNLKELGTISAFDSKRADFQNIGTSPNGNIYVNRVLHKSFIEVAEKGTKAGAATAVEMVDECAMLYEKVYDVILDRPFVYMIYSTKDNIPLFIGVYEGK